MASLFAFRCRQCGQRHAGSPSFACDTNRLPDVPYTLKFKTRVRLHRGGDRPGLELERGSHLLAEHLYRGFPSRRPRRSWSGFDIPTARPERLPDNDHD